jgi:uncharacterized protein (TIGR04255 family)
MATYNGPLSKAPVREALIDIQFEQQISNDVIKAFNELASSRFENSMPLWQTFLGISFTPDGPDHNPPSKTAIGVRLENKVPPHVLQCRTNGFTFSRLSPYNNWDDLRLAAKSEWDEFLKIAPNFTINRIAVRYINELKIPLPFKDFSEYLSCPPEVPEGLPQAVSSFLQRVVIPDHENNCTSIITQALNDAGVVPNESITVLLDIDVFRTVRVDSINSELIWNELGELRNIKNKMFFGHITDEMVERIK